MDKLELIIPYIMTTVILLIITIIILRLFNYILQRRMLELGHIDDYALKFLTIGAGLKNQSLKWAILLFFGGLGLIVIQYQPYPLDNSSIPYGIESVFLAAGFFIYYLLDRKKDK